MHEDESKSRVIFDKQIFLNLFNWSFVNTKAVRFFELNEAFKYFKKI